MSTVTDFNRIDDCNKIDGRECVEAFVEASLNEDSPSLFHLKSSWGETVVDLSPAFESIETLTTLQLSPAISPNCLVYTREDGETDCIHGDDLSKIVSMMKLKDVAETPEIADGEVYIYNEASGAFVPFNLVSALSETGTDISGVQDRITELERTVAAQETRIQTLEALLTKPSGVPSEAKVTWGNVNTYADPNAVVDSSGAATSLDRTHGYYTHSTSTDVVGDQILG